MYKKEEGGGGEKIMKRDKYVKTKLNRRLAWDMKNKVTRMEEKKWKM